METVPQNNLFGQYQPTPIKGEQMPLFHQPVEVKTPDKRDATDKKIAARFDASATPTMFPATAPQPQKD